jgi:hypothetical protein
MIKNFPKQPIAKKMKNEEKVNGDQNRTGVLMRTGAEPKFLRKKRTAISNGGAAVSL